MSKETARNRRGKKTKIRIRQSGRARLVVHRSAEHIYAQIVEYGPNGDKVLVSSSTLDSELRTTLSGKKCEKAYKVGEMLAKRANELQLSEVAFDRAGYRYHGRVKALADGARAGGLNF